MKMEEFDKSSLYYVDSTPEGTRYSLYDTASWKNGLAFKNIDFSETGLPVIKIAELNNGISSSTAYTDKTYSQDVFLTKGDYVFSWSGNPETSIDIYKYNLPDGWLNQHIFKVTPKTEIIDKGFFFYLMKFLKPYFKKIATNKQTTGLGHVTISDLQRMSVTLPSLPTQQKIAAILSSLDDKIELNNKINTNLEQQAQALFKNWFVDFEPFGGKMPERWKVGKLCDIANYSSEKIEINKLTPETYYSTENMLPSKGGIETATSLPSISQTTRCLPGETIISNIRPYFKKIFYCTEEVAGCSTDVLCFKPKNKYYSEYLYQVLYSDIFFDYMVLGSKGTKMPRGDKQQIMNYPITIPDELYLHKYKTFAKPILSQIDTNRKENKRLSEIRDTLLPKLMNGEIRQY